MSSKAITALVGAPAPTAAFPNITPDQVEFYVRAGIHQDRTPGKLLVVAHPGRFYKVPRELLDGLREAGFAVDVVETQEDRSRSVERIRDALQALAEKPGPLDLLVVSGDGSLDHHVLVAAYWACYPDLICPKPGAIDCRAVDQADLDALPERYRESFFAELPDTSGLDASEQTLRELWLLRAKLESDIRKGRHVGTLLRRSGRTQDDTLLRVAILAVLFPHKVVMRAHGFDLSGLANAEAAKTFAGLYPCIRSISTYPAGTAADNAVFAGVPGWGYGLVAGLLTKLRVLQPLRRWLEGRVTRAFLKYFLRDGVVVPARISVVGFDGDWQRISSHAAGGPGGGHFFAADLTAKTKGLLGYLKRIPRVIFSEGIFGSTIVRVCSRFSSGAVKSYTEGQMSEGLYTNRTFIGGVGSVPTTDPTSFAGQSSLCVIVPIWYRNKHGQRMLNFSGLAGFFEAIVKGIAARTLHLLGIGAGTLAGGGKFKFLAPEHQVAIKEGEQIEIEYLTMEGQPRAVPVQVSGDPFQAYRLDIRSAWGPVPLLANSRSLLLACTRRSLADLRLQQSYRLDGIYIGGVHHFLHRTGEAWTDEFIGQTGLLKPPRHLPTRLAVAQQRLVEAWQQLGTGEFVDTTESGLKWGRAGRFAHNNDQSAHLLLLKEPGRMLLVRQVRAASGDDAGGFETRTHYRAVGGAYIIHRSQTIFWRAGKLPKLLQEEHYFRNAEEFQQQALTFFPVVASSPEEPTLDPERSPPKLWESSWESEPPGRLPGK